MKDVGVRTARELKTLAMVIDGLGAGQLPQVADICMQRLKALQSSVIDGNWSTAKRLELLPDDQLSLATFEERRIAARDELLHLKLREAQDKAAAAKRGQG